MYVRSPNLAAHWDEGRLLIEEFRIGVRVEARPVIVELLDAFARPARPSDVVRRFRDYTAASVRAQIERLRKLKFLRPASAPPAVDVARRWRGAHAAALYHFATRDLRYVTAPGEQLREAAHLLSGPAPPSLYKVYASRPKRRLPPAEPTGMSLADALRLRRTTRKFRRFPASAADVGAILKGTWGQTGWLDAGVFGRLVGKSSPSGGARHPIECYLLAWNVKGLRRGLYHYNVRKDVLELLKLGTFRKAAVEIASGQSWVGNAAFVCVMTAVADRSYWKYRSSKAYSIFLLDAGHLGQTFCLLATAHGLGAFTTAAIQHTRAETLIGLDGVMEFPVYVCGAGVANSSQTTDAAPFNSRSGRQPSPGSPSEAR